MNTREIFFYSERERDVVLMDSGGPLLVKGILPIKLFRLQSQVYWLGLGGHPAFTCVHSHLHNIFILLIATRDNSYNK